MISAAAAEEEVGEGAEEAGENHEGEGKSEEAEGGAGEIEEVAEGEGVIGGVTGEEGGEVWVDLAGQRGSDVEEKEEGGCGSA